MERRTLLTGLAATFAMSGVAQAGGGRRSLTGVWTNATYTSLQRPKDFTRLRLTAAEAEAYEAPRRALSGSLPSAPDALGQAESEFQDRGAGLLRVNGEIRSSIIVDPADGRIPYTKAAREKLGTEAALPRGLDNPEQRQDFERCLATSGTGAPIIPSQDGNVTAFVETRDALVIVCEKLNDTRIVQIGDAPPTSPPPSWSGTSVGRWEGDTLVVETTGLRPGISDRYFFWLSDHSRVTERFTRIEPTVILYAFTVEDPLLLTQPWRGEMVFTPAPGRIYEYACHEGNYGLPDILRAARRAEGRAGS